MKSKFPLLRRISKTKSALNDWAIYGDNPEFERLYWEIRLADDFTYFLRMKLDLFLRKIQHGDEPRKNFMIAAVYKALDIAKFRKKQYEKIDPKGRAYDPGEKALDEFLTILMEFKKEITDCKEKNIDDCVYSFEIKIRQRREKAAFDMQTITGQQFQRSFKSITDAADIFKNWSEAMKKTYYVQFGK